MSECPLHDVAIVGVYNTRQARRLSDTNEGEILMESVRGKEVIVLFGTWCHDSEREVPRLLKLLDQSEVDLQSLTLFAVDRNKTDPDGFAARLELQYTPTIIVSEDGREIARIVERPIKGLATDFQGQLSP